MTVNNNRITGVILAGGEARRMQGEDKGLVQFSGKPLIAHVIDSIRTQTHSLIISANRNINVYQQFNCPVIRDKSDGFQGPLAGMASCMEIAKTELMVCVPCDSPFLPGDLVARLYRNLRSDDADICMAVVHGRAQPVFALMKTGLLGSLLEFLAQGKRKTDNWYLQHRLTTVDFTDNPAAFMNLNTTNDISQATTRLHGNRNNSVPVRSAISLTSHREYKLH